MSIQEDEDDDSDTFTLLLPPEPDDAKALPMADGSAPQQLHQQHYIRSIDLMVVIRQLPSQGIPFQLWPAATTLVMLLDHHRSDPDNSPLSAVILALSSGQDRPHIRVLELGSGTGLVGIAAAATLGANVTVTDLPYVLPNLHFNAEANSSAFASHGGAVHVAPLRWGEPDDVEVVGRDFDLILASDVVYHDHLFDPLLQTLRLLLGGEKNGVFLMAHLRRWKKDGVFFKRAKKLFNVTVVHVDRPVNGSRIGVVVYCFTGKVRGLNSGASRKCLISD